MPKGHPQGCALSRSVPSRGSGSLEPHYVSGGSSQLFTLAAESHIISLTEPAKPLDASASMRIMAGRLFFNHCLQKTKTPHRKVRDLMYLTTPQAPFWSQARIR